MLKMTRTCNSCFVTLACYCRHHTYILANTTGSSVVIIHSLYSVVSTMQTQLYVHCNNTVLSINEKSVFGNLSKTMSPMHHMDTLVQLAILLHTTSYLLIKPADSDLRVLVLWQLSSLSVIYSCILSLPWALLASMHRYNTDNILSLTLLISAKFLQSVNISLIILNGLTLAAFLYFSIDSPVCITATKSDIEKVLVACHYNSCIALTSELQPIKCSKIGCFVTVKLPTEPSSAHDV